MYYGALVSKKPILTSIITKKAYLLAKLVSALDRASYLGALDILQGRKLQS